MYSSIAILSFNLMFRVLVSTHILCLYELTLDGYNNILDQNNEVVSIIPQEVSPSQYVTLRA